MNNALISLGSNMACGVENMQLAIKLISQKAYSADFSAIYDTEPEGEHRHAKYKNCVGKISTPESFDEWETFFKNTEKKMGRTPEMKIQGNVPIDLDIVIWNEEVKRPHDLNREYLRKGIAELR